MEDSSADSYGVAAEHYDEQEETSTLHTLAAESKPTGWTNEKHSLFLKSMEATFVDQLHKSLDLFGPNESRPLNKHNHSQFKVLQNGRWSKIDFRKDKVEKDGVFMENPWIQHYRCSEKQAIRNFLSPRAKKPSSALWHQDSAGSNKEGTDQNFEEEDLEGEKPDRTHDMKRTKTSTNNTNSSDNEY